MKRNRRTVLAVAGVAIAAICVAVLSPRVQDLRYRAEASRALRSSDPETRKKAAWKVIDRPDPVLETSLIDGVLGREPNPDVRETYVYALGHLGDPRSFAAVEAAIDADPSGYVRAAAWLAAARIDPDQFRTLAEASPRPLHAWDRIGLAQGWLCLGDARGVAELLQVARQGDESQRYVASRALSKWLRPVLDAVGRWPADADPQEGQLWPPELVNEVERRCAGLDVQAIARDTGRHVAQAASVRRGVTRLTRARDGLARLLFAH